MNRALIIHSNAAASLNRFTVFLYLIIYSIAASITASNAGSIAASNAAIVNYQEEILYLFLHNIFGCNAGRNAASVIHHTVGDSIAYLSPTLSLNCASLKEQNDDLL